MLGNSQGIAKRPRRHGLWLALAAVALIALGIALGRWQLDRAAQKEAMQAEIDAQAQRLPLDQARFIELAQPTSALYRFVHLRGRWIGAWTVYLDNRQMHGTPGFEVLTPFALEGTQQVLMVRRGWVQRNFLDRTQLAPVATPAGVVDLTGRIVLPPGNLLVLGPDVRSVPGSAPIRQNLDLYQFATETELPLRADVMVQQEGRASEGLQRDWGRPALGIERHYGYAFQWFSLSALVAVIYMLLQFILPWWRARHA